MNSRATKETSAAALERPATVQPRARDVTAAIQFAFAHLTQSQAPTMAANLAFRTLFGMLPVRVVATIVTRALLGDGFNELVANAIETLGLHDIAVAQPQDASGSSVALGAWIESLVREAGTIDLSAIGFVGALAVIFSAVWTMVAIEASFNAIYRAPSGRSIVRRVLIYWFVITAGPVLLAAIPFAFRWLSALVGSDSSASLAFMRLFELIGGFMSVWLLISAAYATVPNAKVNLRAAILGAFVATLLIELGKRFLGASLAGSFSASRLYGSLGLVPLFMMWVYLMWLAVLFGLQISAILQSFSRNGRMLASAANTTDIFEPSEAIPCFRAICERFRTGNGASIDTLVRNCAVTPSVARELLAAFERHGLAHRIDGDDRRFSPSRPPESIRQGDALRVGFALVDGGVELQLHDEIAELRKVQLAQLGERSF